MRDVQRAEFLAEVHDLAAKSPSLVLELPGKIDHAVVVRLQLADQSFPLFTAPEDWLRITSSSDEIFSSCVSHFD